MKKTFFTMAALLGASAAHAQLTFTSGDIVVLRDGDGTAALSSAGTAVFLNEYSTSGTLAGSLAIPSTGGSALVNSGTAASEGQISLAANGTSIALAGYNVAAGTAGVAGSSTIPRGVGSVDANGNFTLAATTTSYFTGNNIRSAATDGSGNYWAAGTASGSNPAGIAYLGTGTPAQIVASPSNTRVVQDVGGNLFFTTGSGSTRGVYEISGTPTTASTAASVISTGSTGSAYDFAFNSGMTVCYVADSDNFSTATGLGGVERWNLVSGTWTMQYSLATPEGTTAGAAGVAVNFSGANPIIYGTTSDGTQVFDVTDTGSGSTPTTLATAPTDEAFRGITFAPVTAVPEPSVLALMGCGLPALVWRLRRLGKS